MNVVYLNRFLDCSDDELRRNYEMQDRIYRSKVELFYKLREKGYKDSDILYMYQVWINKNKSRIKLLSDPCPQGE